MKNEILHSCKIMCNLDQGLALRAGQKVVFPDAPIQPEKGSRETLTCESGDLSWSFLSASRMHCIHLSPDK